MNHRVVAALICAAGAGLLQQPAQRPAAPAQQSRTVVVYKSPT